MTDPAGIRCVSWSRKPGSGGSYSSLPASVTGTATTTRRPCASKPGPLTVTEPERCSTRRTTAPRDVSADTASARRRAMLWARPPQPQADALRPALEAELLHAPGHRRERTEPARALRVVHDVQQRHLARR